MSVVDVDLFDGRIFSEGKFDEKFLEVFFFSTLILWSSRGRILLPVFLSVLHIHFGHPKE